LPTGLGWLCSLTPSCRSHPSAHITRSCPLPWPCCSLFPCCSCPRALRQRPSCTCYRDALPPARSAPRQRRCGASPSSTHGYTHSCTTVRVVSHSCACAAACPYATPHFSRTMLPFPFPSPSIH
jgi:hypothetical protein